MHMRMKRFLLSFLLMPACAVLRIDAAISVGPAGTGVLKFDAAPAASEWSTGTVPGGASSITTAAQLDAAVQAVNAANLTAALSATTVTNPVPEVHLPAYYNSAGHYVQMRPAGVAATLLLATLQNNTGASQSSIFVAYTFRVVNPPFDAVAENVRGWRAFWSLTGLPGDWHLIPEFSGGSTAPLWTRLPLGFWPAGTRLFLLWADDDSFASGAVGGLAEGAYTLDDFSAFPDNAATNPRSGVTIFSPDSGQSFVEGTAFEIVAYSTPGSSAATNVLFYDRTSLLGSASSLPSSFLYTNAAPGLHILTAVAVNSGVALTSAPVSITVTTFRPVLTITDFGPGLIQLTWPEVVGGFQLQYTTALRPGVWTPVFDPDNLYDGVHHVDLFDPPRVIFFRLEKR